MKIISGPRASGKTTEAIKLANEEGAYLVVSTRERARAINNEKYPDPERFQITYDELLNHRGGQHVRKVVIDNMEDFVQRVVRQFAVAGGTITHTEITLSGEGD